MPSPFRIPSAGLLATLASLLLAAAPNGNTHAAQPSAPARAVETVELAPHVTMEFVRIAAGTFAMGTPETAGSDDEFPVHRVTLTRAFYLGKFEVTQRQWQAVMGDNPSRFRGANRPVETVSWDDCQQFLAKLSARTGRRFRLPTEAEWEYACRAGTDTLWSCGDDETRVSAFAWLGENAGGTTHEVGTRRPNAWGVYDLHGNVAEWTADGYEKHAYSRPNATDPHVPVSAANSPVCRGGAWGDSPDMVRSGARNTVGAAARTWGIGFRCVLETDR